MTTIRRFPSDNERISCQVIDLDNNFLWIAYEQNSDGICIIQKVSAFSPDQVYFTIEREVSKISQLFINDDYIYAIYSDSTLIAEKLSITNPLTSTQVFNRQIDLVEYPIDIIVEGFQVFILTPGEETGENAKVLIYDTDGNFDEEIDLIRTGEEVLNARSFAMDENGDLWIGTYTDPTNLIRVYQETGGDWNFAITEIDS